MSSPVSAPILRRDLESELLHIAERLPAPPDGKHFFTLADKESWVRRTAHDIDLVTARLGSGRVADVGGGFGLFGMGLSLLGFRSVLVEDFFDIERLGMLDETLRLLAEHDVEVLRHDILADEVDLGSLDGVACFHVLEHLPLSPKPLFHRMRRSLRPGGVFVLAGPNAVNLRKRVTMPLGRSGWSPMEEWYESRRFRGHVREPRADDLRYIARDLGLVDVTVTGANYLGLASPDPRRRRLAELTDAALRRRPELCSDLYLVGRTPSAG